MAGEHTQTRVAAVGALAALAGESSAADLAPLLEDTDLKVRFAAALATGHAFSQDGPSPYPTGASPAQAPKTAQAKVEEREALRRAAALAWTTVSS